MNSFFFFFYFLHSLDYPHLHTLYICVSSRTYPLLVLYIRPPFFFFQTVRGWCYWID